MEDIKRHILSEVAAGTLTPEQAIHQLDEAERQQAGQSTASSGGSASNEAASGPLSRVRLAGTFGRVSVVGDPNVREAVAEGAHTARREGDLLIIEGGLRGEDIWDFSFGRHGRWRNYGPNSWPGQELRLSMNPDLPLDIELLAGQLRVRGVHGRMRVQVSAGSATIDDLVGPVILEVMSGSLRASGVINQGASRIRCDMGSVNLILQAGSSVAISGRATMGRVSLPGEPTTGPRGGWTLGSLTGDTQTVTVGGGAATLDIETSMGNVAVEAHS